MGSNKSVGLKLVRALEPDPKLFGKSRETNHRGNKQHDGKDLKNSAVYPRHRPQEQANRRSLGQYYRAKTENESRAKEEVIIQG